jgi:hypothetical protein
MIMKNWFKVNLKSFLLSLTIPIGFILFILLLPKWIIILLSALTYLGILGFKISKNKPF